MLLQRGINQSLGKSSYEDKRDAYLANSANLLARSLHPLAYQNNPAFLRLIDRTGLPFCAYEHFEPEQQQERQELYIRIAEWVWNPSRLDLDGEKPPLFTPIAAIEEEAEEKVEVVNMTGPWGEYIRRSDKTRGWFMRDPVHANERGFQILGRILEKYFADP